MLARPRVAGVLAASLCLCTPAGASGHHALSSPSEHVAEDTVVHSPALEDRLGARTATATRADAKAAAAAVTGDEHVVGQWGPVVNWPVVGVHVAMLPNGKVLAYDSVGDRASETFPIHDHTRATVWDPATGTQTPVNVNTGFNVFCSGLAHLANGSVFLAGGNKDAALHGIRQTHIFNPSTNAWTLGPNMAFERWYPSVTPLRDGEMLITEGGPNTPEVRTTTGGLRTLSNAAVDLPLYPWIDVAPDGRAFYSGPGQTMRSLNPAGGGSWQTHGNRDASFRSYGSHALYDVGKILVAGGGASTNDARVINLNGASPSVSATAPMANGRRQHNLTVLADGTVLATGGNSSGADLVDLNAGVYPGELWNPASGQWTTLAPAQVTRQYHSTALLLPDGRVLSAGGGICGRCDTVGYLAKNAQVFTPPYLFRKDGSGQLAPRPKISSAPSKAQYGGSLQISTPSPTSISKVALVRLGAVTHSVDMEQRYVPLSFTRGSTSVTAAVPGSANVLPPGPYMLFVVDSNGVPSIARMVNVNARPSVSLTQPASGATFTAPATIGLAATASDPNGTVNRVEFFNGSTKLGQDSTAPYTFSWTGVGPGTYAVTARAFDNDGAATTSAARTITVTSQPAPPSSYASLVSGTSGVVSYWRLGESTGTTAADVLGRNPGSYAGGVTLGRPGALVNDSNGAAGFDGVNDEVTAGGSGLALGGTGTLEGWFRWTAGVAVMRDTTTFGGWMLAFERAGLLSYRVGGATYDTTRSIASVRNGAWHHLALTVANGATTLYVDGAPVHQGTGAPSVAAVQPWRVMHNGTYGDQFSSGDADEVAIYSTALSPQTIAEHYTAGTR